MEYSVHTFTDNLINRNRISVIRHINVIIEESMAPVKYSGIIQINGEKSKLF